MWWVPLAAAGAQAHQNRMGRDAASGLARKDRQMAREQFAAQMDESIQRRVADARKAGIHPLFALGGSVGASPTISAGGSSPAPQGDVGGLIAQAGILLAQRRESEARAKRDEAEALYLDSQRARVEQGLSGQGRDVAGSGGVVTYPYPAPDMELGGASFYTPEVPTSSRPGVRSGVEPLYVESMDQNGRKIQTYNPNLGLDEIAQVTFAVDVGVQKAKDFAEWVSYKLTGPGENDVKRLERKLEALKRNPESARKAQQGINWIEQKLRDLYNKWRK